MANQPPAPKNIIAADYGYGDVKIFDGKNKIKFQSLLSRARAVRFINDISGGEELNKINVKIDGEDWFVGDLAYRQGSEILQILDKEKFGHKATKILIKAALAYLARNLSGNPKKFNTITGLPVSVCSPENIKMIESVLEGEHTAEFDWALLKKPSQKVEFKVEKVKVIPQPVGTLFDMVLDDKGNVKETDDALELAEGSVAIIDIGFGTTDFMISDGFEYIDKYSRSINSAVSNVCGNLANRLSEQLGDEIQIYEMQRHLLTKEIASGGRVIDLKGPIENVLDDVFQEIYTTGQSLWKQKKNIDAFIITGGGSYLFYDRFKHYLGAQANIFTPQENAEYSNVSGFYKFMLNQVNG
jgi:plasmid segregation protein ParM